MIGFMEKFKKFLNLDLIMFFIFFGIMNVFYFRASKINIKHIEGNSVSIQTGVGIENKQTVIDQKPIDKNVDNQKLKDILKQDYVLFVKELGQNINDPKFYAVLNAGDKTLDKVVFDHDIAYSVDQLIPTQNEIDVDKSLKYPLSQESPEKLVNYLTLKGQPFAPGGAIVTAGGKYIVDGHHRWSQLYLINPKAKIKAVNIHIDDPVLALKVVQLAIASVNKKITSALVEGKNLLKMKKEDFDKWIRENMKISAINAFGAAGMLGKSDNYDEEKFKKIIIDYIWNNAVKMQNENAPIKNAFNRGIMPQTGDAPNWKDNLEKGLLDIR